jgi:hypothetical protein
MMVIILISSISSWRRYIWVITGLLHNRRNMF